MSTRIDAFKRIKSETLADERRRSGPGPSRVREKRNASRAHVV
jgi:hypothetical protein